MPGPHSDLLDSGGSSMGGRTIAYLEDLRGKTSALRTTLASPDLTLRGAQQGRLHSVA